MGDGSIARSEDARVCGERSDELEAEAEDEEVVCGVGSVRASDSANIPPPQPTSRYFRPCCCADPDPDPVGLPLRHDAMKSCRRGFMRCRIREGPCGSHHVLAREAKCVSSAEETEEVGFEVKVEELEGEGEGV